MHQDYLGVDISKDFLDLYDLRRQQAWRIANDPKAIAKLMRRMPHSTFTVFEATSVYDRPLRKALTKAGRPFARVNPRRAREFARATGVLAKTDKVDAAMLAHLGSALKPQPSREASPQRQHLAELLQRRNQLVEMRKQEKTRLKQVDNRALQNDIKSLIRILTNRIAKLENTIKDAIKSSARLSALYARLLTAPGIGPITAVTLIAHMPELGDRDRRSIAALAGLAPLPDDSGRRKGYRKIWGGRANITRVLYLAALSARKANPFKSLHQRLRDKNKQPKAAIIAVARKLIVTLNAMLRDGKDFNQPAHP